MNENSNLTGIEIPSGKDKAYENFPVGSLFVPPAFDHTSIRFIVLLELLTTLRTPILSKHRKKLNA